MFMPPPTHPSETPAPRPRRCNAARLTRCLLLWPIAMGVLWWPLFLVAWNAAGLDMAGFDIMVSMDLHAIFWGFLFYLTVVLPVLATAGRRWGWRIIPAITSLIYIASGSLLSWWFVGAFAVFITAMLLTELTPLPKHLLRPGKPAAA